VIKIHTGNHNPERRWLASYILWKLCTCTIWLL